MGAPKFKPQNRRLLFIDEQIKSNRFPSCATIAKEIECSAKTIQRDIDYMRDVYMAPIEYDQVRRGLYYSNKTWYLPSIMMSEGELFAMLVGSQAMTMFKGTPVAEELKMIFLKLAENMPDKLSIAPEYVFSRFSFRAPPSRAILPDVWKQVVRGVQGRHVIEIMYQSPRYPEPVRHTIHPYHLVNLEGEWYVLARSEKWSDLTQYSLGRILKAAVKDEQFQIPNDFDAEKILSQRFGRFIHGDGGKTITVKLLFSKKISTYIQEKIWHPQQTIRKCRDGSIELAIPVHSIQDVVSWVLGFGPDVTVSGPKELRDLIRDTAEQTSQLYSAKARPAGRRTPRERYEDGSTAAY